jgi:hypothetical protein
MLDAGALLMIRVGLRELGSCKVMLETTDGVDTSTTEYRKIIVKFDECIAELQQYLIEQEPSFIDEDIKDPAEKAAIRVKEDMGVYFTARADFLFMNLPIPKEFKPFFLELSLEAHTSKRPVAETRGHGRTTRSQAVKQQDNEGINTIEVIVPHYSERRSINRFQHYYGLAPDPARAGEIIQTRRIPAPDSA